MSWRRWRSSARGTIAAGGGATPPTSFLLLENGDKLLLESGDLLGLEQA